MKKHYEALSRLIGLILAVFLIGGICWGVIGVAEYRAVIDENRTSTELVQTNNIDIIEPLQTTHRKPVDEVIEELDVMVTVVEEEKKNMTIEERIIAACEKYDIPWEIPLAIARLETGWFKSNAYINGNNPGGMSRNEKPIYYDTIEEGVEAFISNLANNYFAIGLDTPEEIGKKYCPVNPEWASLVRQLMEYEV